MFRIFHIIISWMIIMFLIKVENTGWFYKAMKTIFYSMDKKNKKKTIFPSHEAALSDTQGIVPVIEDGVICTLVEWISFEYLSFDCFDSDTKSFQILNRLDSTLYSTVTIAVAAVASFFIRSTLIILDGKAL